MPMAKARPARDITLIDRPRTAIATKDPTIDTGIASEMTSVAEPLRRKEAGLLLLSSSDIDVLLNKVNGGVYVRCFVINLGQN